MTTLFAARARFFARILGFFRADAWRIVLLIIVIGVSTLLGLAQVWPLALLADVVLAPTAAPRSALLAYLPAVVGDSSVYQIMLLAGMVLALRVLQELLSLQRTLLHVGIAHRGILRVRCALFRKLQALSLDFHRSSPQGDNIYRLMQDSPGCEQILGVWIEIGVAVMTLAVMLAVLLTRCLELSMVALAVVPLLLFTNIAFGKRLKRESCLARESDSQLTSVTQRSMASIVLTQAFLRERCEFDRFTQAAGQSAEARLRVQWRMALYRLCVGVIFGGGGAVIFGYGGYLVWQGTISLGDLMIFSAYLAMFYDPLCKISGAGANMQQGVTGMQRVLEVLDLPASIDDPPHGRELACQPRTLQLHDVSFGYLPGRPALKELNLAIQPGQMVAFVGSSGAGKSSLLNLLPRFYDPTGGQITLDGINIKDVRLADLRRHVALVLQENPILPASIQENIAYGRPDATLEQIRAAARLAGADAFIEQLAHGYDTVVAEAGANLSGGQRQRIAIARALLTEAPLILFDEPTSALDPVHERKFTAQMEALRGQRTVIMVSHRLSTVQNCDQIFVIEQGRLVEQGTHRELLARHGHYWQMAQGQLGLESPALECVSADAA